MVYQFDWEPASVAFAFNLATDWLRFRWGDSLARVEADQRQRADTWFAEHWQGRKCPTCDSDTWEIAQNLGQIPNLLPFGLHGGNTVPVLLIQCTTCGQVVPINAIIAGVLDGNAGGIIVEAVPQPGP